MSGRKTRSKKSAQPAPTQGRTRKTRAAKATVADDPPPAKLGCKTRLPKPIGTDKGGNEPIAEAPQAPRKTARPAPRKKVAQVAQDTPPDEDEGFTSSRRWGRNAPLPPVQAPPRTETPPPPHAHATPRTEAPPPPPAQATPRTETPPPPTQGPPAHAETPTHPATQGPPCAETPPPPSLQCSPSHAETLPPPSTQPRHPRSQTPESEPEDPNDHLDKGYTPSGSDFGETEAA
ncbi:hypothetical protein DXG01_009710 [Tephrocybe rancida]|nr:hypothetical protein DXG01_009710 [Tephrocybe rancida]